MMKNLLLLGLVFAAGIEVANAQNTRVIDRSQKGVKVAVATITDKPSLVSKPRNANSSSVNKIAVSAYGTQIGNTFYDLPTNSATGNRLLRHPDGTISAVWTEGCAADASRLYPNRGIGYNYFNGTTWVEGADGTCPDQHGIASSRQGWPEIMLIGNKEVVISHSGTGIAMTTRAAKGTGAWAPTTADLPFTTNINGVAGNDGTWPRAINNGNTIHMIYTINNDPLPTVNGVQGPFVYNRSDDGGTTWSKQNIMLPGMVGPGKGAGAVADGFTSIGGDDYAMAVKGNTVAIVSGSLDEPWTLWKSTDNGDTFTKRIIDRITDADTFMTAAGDTGAFMNDALHNVLIDNNGMVHVWAGEMAVAVRRESVAGTKQWVMDTNAAGSVSVFTQAGQSIIYWNENMPAGTMPWTLTSIAPARPGQTDTWIASDTDFPFPYSFTSLASMPNATIDAAGNIYVVYSAVVRGASITGTSTGQPFRDLYIMKRRATDGAWSIPINIPLYLQVYELGPGSGIYQTAAENFEESIHPTVAREIGADNILHMIWMSDSEPGMHVRGDEDIAGDNAIMYKGLDVAVIPFVYGTVGVKDDISAYVNSIVAYPNPTNGKADIRIDMKKASDVTVKITNLMGQEVVKAVSSKMASGQNNLSIDISGLANGIYLYTVTSENFTVTNRIMKK